MKINLLLLILLLATNGLWLGSYLLCEPKNLEPTPGRVFHYEPKIIFNVNTDSVRPENTYSVTVFPCFVVKGAYRDVELWGGSRYIHMVDQGVPYLTAHEPSIGSSYLPEDSLFRDSVYSIFHKAIVVFPLENGDTLTLKDSARVPVVARR